MIITITIPQMWLVHMLLYYIDESVLLGTKPRVDSIRHFIRDPSGVFSLCHLWVSYRSMTSGLSLKLYLNSLVYHRNIFGSSSQVFGNILVAKTIFYSLAALVRKILFYHSKIKFISPCIRLARGKFKLTNQLSAGGKKLVSSRQCKLSGKALESSNFSHWRLH